MALEREIKLRFDSAGEARARVLALGAVPLRPRRLQRDALFDTSDRALAARRSALRIRDEDGRCRVTFKGPPQPGIVKLREEHETTAGDSATLTTIFTSIGLHVWFRYEKYREEFAAGDAIIAIDETPIGTFIEIEGSQQAIADTARALGRGEADYITLSYRTLFEQHCGTSNAQPADMTFPASPHA